MGLFRDIRSKRLLVVKGALFVVLAAVAGGLLILRSPGLDIFVLLAICVWASCRAYYFAFYVIENYVDSEFRFSGLVDLLKYAVRGTCQAGGSDEAKQGSDHE